MSRQYRSSAGRQSRDDGFTLIETLVVIGMIGLLTAVIAGGISVIFRTESGVGSLVTEAHDRQQIINYFPGDVQAAGGDPDRVRVQGDPDTGSGCDALGSENALRIDYGTTFVAYRVDPSVENGVTRLDRYNCNADGSAISVINLADRLAVDGATPPVDVNLSVKAVPAGPLETDRVTISWAQPGGPATLSASPRSEQELADAVIAGDCTANPMDETLQFSTFIKGDVRFTNGPQIKWASGIGGNLSFTGGVSVGQNLNQDADLPTITPFGTALYINKVDWTNSSGSLTIHANRDVVIDDRSNTHVANNGNSAYELNGPNSPSIVANGQSDIKPIEEIIDFGNAFSVLRSCSVALAQLPGTSCADCAVHLEILDQNGNPLPSGQYTGGNMKLRLVSGKVNVLNVTASQFAGMGNMSFEPGNAKPDATTPLIVNITDAGQVNLSNYPGQGGIGDWVKYTLWNFPNADTVYIQSGNDGVWGTVFAPLAHVISSTKIEGGVVAASWTHDQREVNGARVFTGQIDWDG